MERTNIIFIIVARVEITAAPAMNEAELLAHFKEKAGYHIGSTDQVKIRSTEIQEIQYDPD